MRMNKFFAATLAACLVGGVPVCAQNSSWGLSFPTEGQPPVGNATIEALKEHNAYYIGNTEEKTIYLTFDAGFENGCTAEILDVLKEKEVPATFFLVGTYISANPELIQRMVQEGHTVANHTTTHPDMSEISDLSAFRNELEQTQDYYRAVTGSEMPKLYRPPRGVYSEENLRMAKELGYKTIFWSLAYVDWNVDNQPTHDQAFSKLLPRIHPGAIILLHSTSKTNTEILGQLIDEYRNMGYQFEGIDQLAN